MVGANPAIAFSKSDGGGQKVGIIQTFTYRE